MKPHTFIFIFFFFIKTTGLSQVVSDSNYIDVNSFYDSVKIAAKAMLFIDSNRIINTGNILQQQFVPFSEFKKAGKIPPHLVTSPTYLKFSLYNSTDTAKKPVFFFRAVFLIPLKFIKLTAHSSTFTKMPQMKDLQICNCSLVKKTLTW